MLETSESVVSGDRWLQLLCITLLGCAAVSAGPVSSPGERPALEGRGSSTHHTLRWGPAADTDPHGTRASHSLTQDLRETSPSFCEEVSARAAGWPYSWTSFLCCHFFSFVCRLGILTVRHLKRLERVILGYLEVYDGPEEEARLKILETLKLLMQYTWPRYNSQQTCGEGAKLGFSLLNLPRCTCSAEC